MSHRGAMGRAPEDTARALEASIADTVDWVEVDVRLTSDGHHVLVLGDVLGRKPDAAARIRDHTLAEIRETADSPFADQRALTLTEGLNLARGRVNLRLNCKDVDAVRLAREVLATKMGSQVIVSHEPAALRAIRSEVGEAVALMAKWQPHSGIDAWVGEARPHAVEIDAEDVTPEVCREFHRRGIKVQAKALGWDDRPEIWDRVVASGVDWLLTGRAEEALARQALKAIRPGGVKVAHHRGASRYAPENTLEALRKSVALGADFVEFDIRTTRDGAFVLIHDNSLDRTTSGRGPVRDRTSGEVATLDAGSWFGPPFSGLKVPTLDAFLDAAAPLGVGLYVDAKDISPEALAEALARHGLTDRAVVYQGAAYLERLRKIAPALRRMPPLRDPSELGRAGRAGTALRGRRELGDPLQAPDRPLSCPGDQGLQRRDGQARVNRALPASGPGWARCDPDGPPRAGAAGPCIDRSLSPGPPLIRKPAKAVRSPNAWPGLPVSCQERIGQLLGAGMGGYRSFIGFVGKTRVGVAVMSNSANDVDRICPNRRNR